MRQSAATQELTTPTIVRFSTPYRRTETRLNTSCMVCGPYARNTKDVAWPVSTEIVWRFNDRWLERLNVFYDPWGKDFARGLGLAFMELYIQHKHKSESGVICLCFWIRSYFFVSLSCVAHLFRLSDVCKENAFQLLRLGNVAILTYSVFIGQVYLQNDRYGWRGSHSLQYHTWMNPATNNPDYAVIIAPEASFFAAK